MSSSSLGAAPHVCCKRHKSPDCWCKKKDLEFDPFCDPQNPKIITYKDVVRATKVIKKVIKKTPIFATKKDPPLYANVYFKLELFHRTNSYKDRTAFYTLAKLTEQDRNRGVVTASFGNWAMALALYGKKLSISVVVVMPENTHEMFVNRCQKDHAKVVLHGHDYWEARHKAFLIATKQNRIFINGSDHPSVIAAGGSIGLEILKDLPSVDAILVPVGGGGLLAGITVAVKHLKPECLVYGVEPNKCCGFFKAMHNEFPYRIVPSQDCNLVDPLAIPIAGYNSFCTCRSLIDKMVLVHEDYIAKAVTFMVENEGIIPEGAAAVGLAALLMRPDALPELREKNVVCIVTGGNMDSSVLRRVFERTYAIEARYVKFTATLYASDFETLKEIMDILTIYKFTIVSRDTETDMTNLLKQKFHFVCEGLGLRQACALKQSLDTKFPEVCEFITEPFSPIPKCICFPKMCDLNAIKITK